MLKAKSAKTEEVINAMEGLTVETAIGPVTMRACDHQAMYPVFVGQIASLPGYPFPVMKDIMTVASEKLAPTCEEIRVLRKAGK